MVWSVKDGKAEEVKETKTSYSKEEIESLVRSFKQEILNNLAKNVSLQSEIDAMEELIKDL